MHHRIVSTVAASLVCCAIMGQSSSKTVVPKNTRNSNPSGYVEYLPNDYDSRSDWNVHIYLHGNGAFGSGSQSDLDSDITNKRIMSYLNNNDEDMVILAPQSQGNFNSAGELDGFIEWVISEYGTKINTSRIHLSAHSGGGTGVRVLLNGGISTFPVLANISSISLSASTAGASSNTDAFANSVEMIQNGTRFWFFHATNDGTINIGGQRNLYINIRGLYFDEVGSYPSYDDFRFTIWDSGGHGTSDDVYEDKGHTSLPQTPGAINTNPDSGDKYIWMSNESWYQWQIDPVGNGGVVAPANTVLPAITGTQTVGEVLSTSNGTWTNEEEDDFTYQWLRSTTPISGATGANYTIVKADVGFTISVEVSNTNSGGTSTAESASTGIIQAVSNTYNTAVESVSVGDADFTWTFDDTIGEQNGLPTQAIGTVSFVSGIAPSMDGMAWQSNGNASINPENDVAINTDEATEKRSISLWFQATNLAGWQNIYEEGGEVHGWHIALYDEYLTLSVTQGGAARNSIQYSIEPNTTYHVVGVFDLSDQSSGSNMELFVNGQSVGNANFITQAFLSSHSGDIQMGGQGDGLAIADDNGGKTKTNFEGQIQRVDYWSEEVLTVEDVQDLYVEGSGVTLSDPPSEIALDMLSIADGTESGLVVSTLSSDGTAPVEYALVSGTGDDDNGKFTIEVDELIVNEDVDFSQQSSYNVRIEASNDGGAFEASFSLSVTETIIAPTTISLDNDEIEDGTISGSSIGMLSSDGSDPVVFTLIEGAGDTDNEKFSIDENELVINENADFAQQAAYSVRIQASNDGGTTEAVFDLSVIEPDLAPTSLQLDNTELADGTASGTVVGNLSADGTAPVVFALAAGEGDADNSSFSIDESALVVDENVDITTQSSYSIRVQATNDAGSFETSFSLSVTETALPPTEISIESTEIADGVPAGTAITTISADGTQPVAFSLVAGEGDADNADFEIVGSELQIQEEVDANVQSSYSIRIEATNSAGSTTAVFAFAVTESGKVGLTVTMNDMTSEYGSEVPPLTFGYSGFIDGDGPADLEQQPTASTNADEQSSVGEYVIQASGGVSDKYSFTYVNGTLEITKADLIVSVEDASIRQGEPLPEFELAYQGFKNDETPLDLDTPPTATTDATSSSEPGEYTIVVAGGMDTNYDFTYENGTLVIQEGCDLSASLVFDELDSTIHLSISGGLAPYTIEWSTGATSESIKIEDAGVYSVEVSDVQSCAVTASITIDQNDFGILGLQDSNRLEVWPNPVRSILHLESATVMRKVSIFSIQGQLVLSFAVEGRVADLDLSSLEKGTYLLTLDDDFNSTGRIILKR